MNSRRHFLFGLTASAAMLSGISPAWARQKQPATRRLAFHSLHTGENLNVTYMRRGRPVPASIRRINHILRDWRVDEVAPIDLGLLDLLSALHRRSGSKAPFDVISGYRSPKTNAKLVAKNRGVAKRSLHMHGMAIDISLPDLALDKLHKHALALEAGGVGIYSRSGFIHVDTGKVRSWGR